MKLMASISSIICTIQNYVKYVKEQKFGLENDYIGLTEFKKN